MLARSRALLGFLAAVTAAAAGPGCASFWGFCKVTNVAFSTDGTAVTAIDPPEVRQDRLEITFSSLNPLGVSCATVRTTRIQKHVELYRYGSGWHVLTAVATVVEGGLATLALVGNGVRADGQTAGEIWLGVDAIASAVLGLTLEPEHSSTVEEDYPPEQWLTGCPPGMEIESRGEVDPVGVEGAIAPARAAAVGWRVAVAGEPIAVRVNGHTEWLRATAAQRCRWATAAGDPAVAAICPPPAPGQDAPPPPPPVLVPPPRIVIELPLPVSYK